jgi:hypothetical protein
MTRPVDKLSIQIPADWTPEQAFAVCGPLDQSQDRRDGP